MHQLIIKNDTASLCKDEKVVSKWKIHSKKDLAQKIYKALKGTVQEKKRLSGYYKDSDPLEIAVETANDEKEFVDFALAIKHLMQKMAAAEGFSLYAYPDSRRDCYRFSLTLAESPSKKHTYDLSDKDLLKTLSQERAKFFEMEMKQVGRDEQDAIIYLAKILPKKAKKRLKKRLQAETSSNFSQLGHFFPGMDIRNALRAGEFWYSQQTMEIIWEGWLQKAVNLSDEEIVLTDELQKKVRKYRVSRRKPPIRPEISKAEVNAVREKLASRYSVQLPEVEVRYSHNIDSAMASAPIQLVIDGKMHPMIREEFEEKRLSDLKARGFGDEECMNIDPDKFVIFLKRRYSKHPVEMHSSLWHEMGHAVAWALKIKGKEHAEGVAMASSILGLLLEMEEGKLSPKATFDQIDFIIGSAQGALPLLGPYRGGLHVIKWSNPNLTFRNRSTEELLKELDESILEAKKVDYEIHQIVKKRRLTKAEMRFVIICGSIAIILLIISMLHIF